MAAPAVHPFSRGDRMRHSTLNVLAFCVVVGAVGLLAVGADKAAAPPTTGPANTPGEVSGGEWKADDGVLTQSNGDTPALILFGDATWTDYTIEVEAQKTGGDEGFLVAVRAKDAEHLVWFNVGGWANTRSAFERLGDDKTDFGDKQTYSPFVAVQ